MSIGRFPVELVTVVFFFAQLPASLPALPGWRRVQVKRSDGKKRDKVQSLRMFVTRRAVSQVVRKKKPSLQDA